MNDANFILKKLSVCPNVCLSICLYFCPSICLYVCTWKSGNEYTLHDTWYCVIRFCYGDLFGVSIFSVSTKIYVYYRCIIFVCWNDCISVCRIKFHNMTISRYTGDVARYKMLSHRRDQGNPSRCVMWSRSSQRKNNRIQANADYQLESFVFWRPDSCPNLKPESIVILVIPHLLYWNLLHQWYLPFDNTPMGISPIINQSKGTNLYK